MQSQIKLDDRSLEWLIKYHSAITSHGEEYKPDFWETMIAYVEQLISLKHIKENKEMKSILIKFENRLLVNYVANQLETTLDLEQNGSHLITNNPKWGYILIHGNKISTGEGDISATFEKCFVITTAKNADIIIEEVIKEYRKPEYKTFTIGGGFNGNKLKVNVYNDKVNFNGQDMSFDAFITMRNALTLEYGGFKIGGDTTLQLTNANTGTKVYIDRTELQPIVETILGKL
jgi:hypothetical protein